MTVGVLGYISLTLYSLCYGVCGIMVSRPRCLFVWEFQALQFRASGPLVYKFWARLAKAMLLALKVSSALARGLGLKEADARLAWESKRHPRHCTNSSIWP